MQKIFNKKLIFTAFVVAAFGSLLCVNGCEFQSRELKAMLTNPVANMQLTTAKEVFRFHEDKGKTLGKPIYAKIRIKYGPTGDHTKEDVYKEIIRNIENNSWRKDSHNIEQKNYYIASLPYESFSLDVEVFNHVDSNTVEVSMSHR